MPRLFEESCNDFENLIIYGRQSNKRISKKIQKKYIKLNNNLINYKVILPGANGSGKIGEKLGVPFIGKPYELHTQTYMSIGCFKTEKEANNLIKYLKTKFLRIMLGTLKVTQNSAKDTWKNVPLFDFSDNKIINWDENISSIDQQLYKFFGLDNEEVEFIEYTAEEMN